MHAWLQTFSRLYYAVSYHSLAPLPCRVNIVQRCSRWHVHRAGYHVCEVPSLYGTAYYGARPVFLCDLEASTEENLVGNVKNIWVSLTLPLKCSSTSPQHGFLVLKMLIFQQGMYSAGTSQRCWWTSSRWTCRSWTSQSSSMHVRGRGSITSWILSEEFTAVAAFRHYHWEHAVFLYTHYDEYDQAANTMMVLSSVHIQVILLRIDSLEIARIVTYEKNWRSKMSMLEALMFTKAHSPIAFAHDQQGTQCFQAGTFSCRSIMDPRFLMIMQKAIPAFGSNSGHLNRPGLMCLKLHLSKLTLYISPPYDIDGIHNMIYHDIPWTSMI